jgi:hypothetical protein
MKRISSIIFKISIVIQINLLLIGCSDYTTNYKQFSSDDLSHLYFNQDTLIYKGDEIEYSKTVAFLRNSTDTIAAYAQTNIYHWYFPYGESALAGQSSVYFDDLAGINWAIITVIREYFNFKAKIILEFDFDNYPSIEEILDPSLKLDTALILGKIYNNVYKLDYPDSSQTNVKRLYFAKKYGFIKIESTDGGKLELIDK